jgi:hypothetical protein
VFESLTVFSQHNTVNDTILVGESFKKMSSQDTEGIEPTTSLKRLLTNFLADPRIETDQMDLTYLIKTLGNEVTRELAVKLLLVHFVERIVAGSIGHAT